jgi:hypothetical protein
MVHPMACFLSLEPMIHQPGRARNICLSVGKVSSRGPLTRSCSSVTYELVSGWVELPKQLRRIELLYDINDISPSDCTLWSYKSFLS